jgi:hypothetical protein
MAASPVEDQDVRVGAKPHPSDPCRIVVGVVRGREFHPEMELMFEESVKLDGCAVSELPVEDWSMLYEALAQAEEMSA